MMHKGNATHIDAPARRAPAGFTLVELMVTIFVAAILVTIAIPSFRHMLASTQLSTTANRMVDALNLARIEAIKRNDDTRFCGDSGLGSGDLKVACGTTQPGAVYTLVGAAGATNAVQVKAAPELDSASQHWQTVNAIRFDARGIGHLAGQSAPYTGTVVQLCSSAMGSKNIRTISMTTGSILTTTTSEGGCP